MRAPPTPLLGLVVLAGLASPALAHGLVNLNVVVPPDCPEGATRCLTTIDAQPAIHAGDELSFFAYNDDRDNHTLHVADNATVEAGSNTSPSRALASSGPIPANGSRDGGTFTVPTDAAALYVWCSKPGHEAEGEHLVVPVEPAPQAADERSAPASALGALAALLAAAWGLALRRGDP